MAKMNLKHYKLDSVEETDKELGRGSFAAVILLNFRGELLYVIGIAKSLKIAFWTSDHDDPTS